MLHWLAAWLQQIIAVVLLAGFIDLLLPNKSMQRYVRLVAGLIILLTILTPIMRLLQGDFDENLDRNMENWFADDGAKEVRMPTLEDIQRDAAALGKKTQASAAALARSQLAEAMRAQLAKQTGLPNIEVDVALDPSAEQGDPGATVAAITVTLPADRNAAAGAAGPGTSAESERSGDNKSEASGSGNNAEQYDGGDTKGEVIDTEDGSDRAASGEKSVEDVPSVDVTVQIEPGEDGMDGSAAFAGQSDYVQVEGAAADSIRRMLSAGWAVDPALVTVRRQLSPD